MKNCDVCFADAAAQKPSKEGVFANKQQKTVLYQLPSRSTTWIAMDTSPMGSCFSCSK
jgi:hypothetical protein